jgi:hypothetical protein
MKRSLLVFVSLAMLGYPVPFAAQSQSKSATRISGALDHVLVTLPSARFGAFAKFFADNFPESWKPWTEDSQTRGLPEKGFVVPGDGAPYVELWNGGVDPQHGYKFGVTATDVDAAEKAKRYFGRNGVMQGGMFTVGSDGPSSHPMGGAFFIDYRHTFAWERDSKAKIATLRGVTTAMIEERMGVQKDFEFYSFETNSVGDGFTATDHTGFSVRVVRIPTAQVFDSSGHVALQFQLKEPHVTREVIKIDKDGKAIYQGKDLVLVLQTHVYDTLKPK